MKLKSAAFALPLFAMLCCLGSGCAGDGVDYSKQEPIPITPGVRAAAADFTRRVSTPMKTSAVLSAADVARYRARVEMLAERARLLGLSAVYLTVEDPGFIAPDSDELREFAAMGAALGAEKIAFGVYVRETDFRCAPASIWRSGPIFRRQAKEADRHAQFIAGINALKNELAGRADFLGVIYALECSQYTSGARVRPPRMLDAWNENCYGLEGGNSRIFGASVDLAVVLATRLPGIPVNLGVDASLLSHGYAGEIAGATAPQLLQAFPRVIVLGRESAPGALVKSLSDHLCDAAVVPAVVVAGHSADKQSGLRRRSWSDLVNSMEYMAKKWREAGCREIIVLPFSRMETLWEENTEKESAK